MEILEYFRILKRHTTIIVLLCLSATITAALLSFLIPDKYEARALVLVRPQENIKISSNREDRELLRFPVSGGVKAETPSNTYIEVIRSRAIAEKVVRNLRLDQEQEPPAENLYKKGLLFLRKKFRDFLLITKQILKHGRVIGRPSPFEEAVEDFQKGISLKAVKDTYAFEIGYAASDPEKAAAVANAAAELFIEHMAEINGNEAKGILEFVSERLDKTESELAEARRLAREFKEKNKTVSFKEETAEKIKIISDLESSLEKTEIKLAGLLKALTPSNPKVQTVQAEKERLLSALKKRKDELDLLPEKEMQLATLQLNVQVAEDIYQVIKREHEQARIRTGMKMIEMEIASQAAKPFYPSKPVRIYYVGGGFSMALLIGIGLAFFLEYLNITIRSMEHVENVLQLRVLATIPEATPGPLKGFRFKPER